MLGARLTENRPRLPGGGARPRVKKMAMRRPRPVAGVAERRKGRACHVAWGTFMQRHPHAHLVTGTCEAVEKLIRRDRTHASLLKELAAAICRHGDYAVTMIRNIAEGDLVMIAIAVRCDADRLAEAVDANVAPRFGDWLTHRSFGFEVEMVRQKVACLAAGMDRKPAGKA
jgi:hypothetical protein